MSFSITSEVTNSIAKLTLAGSLDSSSASQMQAEIQKVAGQSPTELVLYLSELTFMASAGLRMLVFAKQKLGTSVQIYLVKPQGQIVDTLQMTGIIHSVHIVDSYPS
ncbi:MAG TPA: anti-sigma factor antagonist [Ferruginibacter sp.]|jgi:anti-anti-sigma factor|nr:anti-sigma factor antagonist [Ferruginibacter sp.]